VVAQRGYQQEQEHEFGQRGSPATVSFPPHSYGDYAQAAQAWGLLTSTSPDNADLVWACEPSSPLGQPYATWPESLTHQEPNELKRPESVLVLDCAYEPLRLSGSPCLCASQLNQVWQLWTPNKALGLTGIRAAYAIAPVNEEAVVEALEAMASSWPVGAHGVALLQAWVQPEVQQWLANSLLTLKAWKLDQIALLQSLGWTCLPSDANFFCAQPVQAVDVSRLRDAGVKLRDATSFGLPGYFRVSVQGPEAQAALRATLQGMLL
jgi:histidinol-phosphate aminotransferase